MLRRRKPPLNGRRRRVVGWGQNVGLTPDPVRTFLERFADAIYNQESFSALRAGFLAVGQHLRESVVLDENGAIRADHPMQMEEEVV
jgi:hypothetical protein